jgi:hypothetical protein
MNNVVLLQCQRGPSIAPLNPSAFSLIDTLERRHGLALVFIEGASNDPSVFDINIWHGSVVLPRQCVFHPVLVVTLRVSRQIYELVNNQVAKRTSG